MEQARLSRKRVLDQEKMKQQEAKESRFLREYELELNKLEIETQIRKTVLASSLTSVCVLIWKLYKRWIIVTFPLAWLKKYQNFLLWEHEIL